MDRINRIVLPENADGALITSDINRRYFTGMKSSAGMLLIFKECAYLIIDFRYIEKARNTVKNLYCNGTRKPYGTDQQSYEKNIMQNLLQWNQWI